MDTPKKLVVSECTRKGYGVEYKHNIRTGEGEDFTIVATVPSDVNCANASFAKELVRRWNAEPDLSDALKRIRAMAENMKETASIKIVDIAVSALSNSDGK